MICPVCGTENEYLKCECCGYDKSCDRELYPTLMCDSAQLPSKLSINRRRFEALSEKYTELEQRMEKMESNLQDLTSKLESGAFNVRQGESGGAPKSADRTVVMKASKTIPEACIGDVVCFGKYSQAKSSESSADNIEWIVIDSFDNILMLISKKILYYSVFENIFAQSHNVWSKSHLRHDLNSVFYNGAFGRKEKERIIDARRSITRKNDSSELFDVHESTDKLFLLTTEEYADYYSTLSAYEVEASQYASLNGEQPRSWWLCSGAGIGEETECVDEKQSKTPEPVWVGERRGVRPCVYVRR